MQKHLKLCLLLSLFLAIFSFGFADTVTIGTGTSTTYYFPIYGLFDYSYSQQIFTKSQIDYAGGIEKVRFYYVNGDIASNKDWTIYMGHTNKTSFGSNTDWVPFTELTQVFSGDVSSFVPANNNWMEIPLDTIFNYNNTDNLVIAIDENTYGYTSMTWGGFSSGPNTGIYYYNYSINPDPTNPPTASSRASIINRLQLVFPTTTPPIAPTLVTPANNAVNQNLPILSWQATPGGGDPNAYDLYLGTDPNPPLFAENITQASYQLSAHAYETDYYWKVVAKNGFGTSSASEVWKFTTKDDHTIREFPFIEGFETGNTNAQAVAGHWAQITGPTNTTKQWMANNTNTDYNRTPKTGSWNAYLQYSGQSTLIRPIVLVGGKGYKLELYARQDGATATNANIKAAYGLSGSLADLTEPIIAETGIVNGDYQLLEGYFFPATDGTYYIGITGFINNSPWYLSIDDIKIIELSEYPFLICSPENINFGEAAFGATIGPRNINLKNEGGGILTITEDDVSIVGSPQFSIDNSVFPINLETAETLQLPVTFVGTVEGPAEATITISYDGVDYEVALSANVLPDGLVVIGDGTANNSLPINAYNKYTYSQTIYRADEILTTDRQIEKIAYHWNGVGAGTNSNQWTVYMGHTNKEAFTVITDWIDLADLTQVYQGTLDIPAENKWIEVELNMPFIYNGIDNLVIAVRETKPGYDSSSYYFYNTASTTGRSIRYFNDYTNPDPAAPPAGTLVSAYPNIRMYFGDVPLIPVISVSPDNINFGTLFFNATSEIKNVTVINAGTGTLHLDASDVEITGTNATLFSFDDSVFPFALETGVSAQIPVYLEGVIAGDVTANLEISYAGNTEIVALSANVLPQEIVIVGEGTSSQRQPMGVYFGYERSAAIYTSAEIGGAGLIGSIGWNVATTTATVIPYKIYLGITTNTQLTSQTFDNLIQDMTLVDEGDYTFDSAGWHTFNLATPFLFVGGNLVVAVETNYGGSGADSYPTFYFTSTANTHMFWSANNSAPTTNGYVNASRPNFILSLGEIGGAPDLSVNPDGDYEFPVTLINTTAQKAFTVINIGGGNINITDITITGDGFALTTEFSPVTIGSAEMYSFTVEYSPTASGDHTATLLIESSAGNHSAELTGSCFDPTIYDFPYLEDFGTTTADWPPAEWTLRSGLYPTPTGTSNQWARGNWLYGATGNNAAKINIWGTSKNGWLITRPINILNEHFELKFDLGLTRYGSTLPIIDPTSQQDDRFMVIISGSPDMSNPVILREWNNQGSSFVFNQIPNTGTSISIPLTGISGIKYFAFYGESTVSNGDNDLYVDNVLIREVPATPLFTLSSDNHDFGDVMINTTASETFTISNNGGDGLIINSIEIDGHAAFSLDNVPTLPVTLGAGNNMTLDAVFAPTAAGDYSASITITDNQSNRYSVNAGLMKSKNSRSRDDHTVALTGSCFDPTITVLPYTENFDSVSAPAMPLGWTVLNPDNAGVFWKTSTYSSHSSPNSMFISYTSTGGGPLDDWAITPPLALEAGKEYCVSFYYRAYDSSCYENLALYFGSNPTATGMTELLWSDEGFNRTSYALVQETVSPTADGNYFFGWYAYSDEYEYGINVDSIMIEELAATPVFAVEPISHDFGEVMINATSNKSIKVSNTGGGQLGITTIEISDNAAFELGTLPTFPVILERDEFFNFNVVFAPTAAGTHNATITITDDQSNRYSVDAGSLRSKNARSRDDHTVALTGSCFDPTIRTFPFFEGFEDGYTHDQAVAVRWTQLTGPDYTAKKWTANNTLTTYNRTPKSGTWNAFLQYSGESTLIRPIMLEANKEYKLKFYARQDGTDADNAKIKASFGTGGTLEGLTETIIAQTGLINGDYQEFSGIFSTETSGLYYIGINGWINNSPWYISLDDISIDYNYIATPDTPADIDANTTVTIAGTGFVGALETTVAPENLTPIPNPAFLVANHQVWQLIGTGPVTLTFHNNDTEDIWIAYVVGGAWVAHEIPAGGSVDIMLDLDAKDASLEFTLGKGGNPTLPVELSYFNAVFMLNDNSVKLSWKTESETQMLGYQIYRSTNKELANAIMITPTIINASNNSTGDSYSYLDSEIESGTYYYWLEAVSYNSSEYYGYQTVVIDIPSTPELPEISSMSNAYPNPFKDMTNVDIAIKGGETGNFTIYNMLGQVVYRQNLSEGNVKIEWNGRDNHGNRCGSGVYFYKLVTPTKSETKKMVIMK